MRALTTGSTLNGAGSFNNNPRCFTSADSSTPVASNVWIYYNSNPTTGDCHYVFKCACQCQHPPPAPPLPPPPPPYAPFAWTTFSSGADCEANGCVTPSSQAECEDAMRALTTKSKLTGVRAQAYPRCYTTADSSTAAISSKIYYNSGAFTGACGYNAMNCACQCQTSPSPPPPPPTPPPDMCECTGNGNQMSCSGTGVRYCGGAEECFATTKVPYGQWDDMCESSDMCECNGNGNQMSCSVSGDRYCGGGEECVAPRGTSYPYGQWSSLCERSDESQRFLRTRRLQP